MLLRDVYSVDINTLLEPPFRIRDLDVVPAHLTLAHPAVCREGPVFKTIGAIPLPSCIVPFVPELNCNLRNHQQIILKIAPSPNIFDQGRKEGMST
jgi:hypothetical protein